MNELDNSTAGISRRTFLKEAALTATVVSLSAAAPGQEIVPSGKNVPWYRRTLRWGQTNITEIDPTRYDIPWWREHWKRTHTQGVIINAGGIFAYYPSKFPLHYRPPQLGDRDLYGELARVAHEDGLTVLARMDSNRAHEPFHQAHPEWFAQDVSGKPYRAGELYVTCINSPYYDEYIPSILREIIERSHPEGITDNSWSGLGRGSVCYCDYCQKQFLDSTKHPLPFSKNWNDPIYRQWIKWNYSRRLEIWDLYNRVTKEAGGSECLWIGMNSGSVTNQSSSFRDCKGICRRAEIMLLDHQARGDSTGFQQNGEAGKLIHGLLGWDKLAPESMAMYQGGKPTFRLSSKPEPEARMWMLDGFAGGLQPWWHHIAAYHEDRRMYHTAEPILRWHEQNQEYLINREPIASVGVVWSQTNTDFYGRDNADELVDLPYRGITTALVKYRIPYLPIEIDQIASDGKQFSVLVLPNLGAISDAQLGSIRKFVEEGGGLIATGESSLCDEWGDPRPDFGLAGLFGAHLNEVHSSSRRSGSETLHSYIRLAPELRTQGDPGVARTGHRHPVLSGFDETDILPFGGNLESLRLDPGATVLATYVPPFPIYPPETSWMREPRTTIPAIIINDTTGGGRVSFLPADLDRRYARDNLPDHGRLLANAVRWAANGKIPLAVEGSGFLDCHLYRQKNRVILHLVNLTSAGTWRAPVDELISIGPLQIRVKPPGGFHLEALRFLVSGQKHRARLKNGWVSFSVNSILDHEVVLLEKA